MRSSDSHCDGSQISPVVPVVFADCILQDEHQGLLSRFLRRKLSRRGYSAEQIIAGMCLTATAMQKNSNRSTMHCRLDP